MQAIRSAHIHVVAFCCLVGLLVATPATAQLHDHLECYKARDVPSSVATVDLSPSDPLFPAEGGCTVKLKSKQVCFPVAANVSEGGQLGVAGPDLTNPYLCYTLRCPSATLPDSLQMSDEFGTRTLAKPRTSTLCAPAVVGVPVTTTLSHGPPLLCADATVPNCDGTCGNSNYACVADAGACICQGQEPFVQCGLLAGPPTCYGTCSGSQSCVEVGGACQCADVYQ